MSTLQKEQLPQPVYPTQNGAPATHSAHQHTATAVPPYRHPHPHTATSPAVTARRFNGRQMLSAGVIAVVVAAISVGALVLKGGGPAVENGPEQEVAVNETDPTSASDPTSGPEVTDEDVNEAAYGLLGDFGTDSEYGCVVDSLSAEPATVQAIQAGSFDADHVGSLISGCVSAASLAEGYGSWMSGSFTQDQIGCVESELAYLDSGTWSNLLSLNMQYPTSETELAELETELFGYCLY